MKRNAFLGGLGAVSLFLAGCHTNSAYKSADFSNEKMYKRNAHSPQLKENEVLGMKANEDLSDNDIKRILDETASLRLKPGSTLLLVQSGAPTPDKEMVKELSHYFTVVPYTGVPSEVCSGDSDAALSKALRLAAAQSKAESILVYWGHLEMKRDDFPTSIVSWVPVVDFMVPDEYQKMRISLKVALIDVRTGNWARFRTEAVEGDMITTRYAREHNMSWPYEAFKQKLYASASQKLRKGYME
jgi:hypothetical protein